MLFDILTVLAIGASFVDARDVDQHQFGVVAHLAQGFVNFHVKQLDVQIAAFAQFLVVISDFLQRRLGRAKVVNCFFGGARVLGILRRCFVVAQAQRVAVASRCETEMVDTGSGPAHGDFAVLVAQNGIDDGRLARRNIAQHGNANLELGGGASSHGRGGRRRNAYAAELKCVGGEMGEIVLKK